VNEPRVMVDLDKWEREHKRRLIRNAVLSGVAGFVLARLAVWAATGHLT
jgi:hypothetical protein